MYFNDFSPVSHVPLITETGQAVKPALFRVLSNRLHLACFAEKQSGKAYWFRCEYEYGHKFLFFELPTLADEY
jgi:hypothetical protein